ncbi:hypothetical protein FTX61_12175 [Nitriliruptoraceae bacterium ZYF776]|nr:hypothetical protein [Profundirhabdus halotolerans]
MDRPCPVAARAPWAARWCGRRLVAGRRGAARPEGRRRATTRRAPPRPGGPRRTGTLNLK